MDDPWRANRRFAASLAIGLLALSGCARTEGRAPFGSVQTYTQTLIPGGPRPRGRMIGPVAPGIDLSRRESTNDAEARPASLGPLDH